jgi:putative addiction module component (TIGR02574 family)
MRWTLILSDDRICRVFCAAPFPGRVTVNTTSRNIVEAALQLTEVERAEMVQELLDSLSPDADRLIDDAWAAELDRRVAAFHRGEVDAVPWSQLAGQD